MSSVSRWRDTDHLELAVATAGGQEAFDAPLTAAMLDDARHCRLAEMRKRHATSLGVALRRSASVCVGSPIGSPKSG